MDVSPKNNSAESALFVLQYNGVPTFSFVFQHVKIDGGEVTFVNDGSSLVIEDCRVYPRVFEICKQLTEANAEKQIPEMSELLTE
jgi:hypothetical protein